MKHASLTLILVFIVGCAPSSERSAPRSARDESATITAPSRSDAACDVTARGDCGGRACPPPDAAPLRTLTGRVSYYADSLHGRRTASGEPYDKRQLTAASRELPFGTVVRITRVGNGRTVVVRINDRGPSARGGRILDLSRRAAECLDMIRAGVTEVRAEIIAEPPPRARR